MKLCPMRFCGYTWHHNPKSLQIASGKKVVRLQIPYENDVLQNFGEKPVVISGTGELYGDDCLEQYKALEKEYEKGKSGVLCLPILSPFYACFESLKMISQPSASVLTYSFSFVQIRKRQTLKHFEKSVEVKENETLWDIAYESDMDIEELVLLNPDIMFINDLKSVEEVHLC